MFSRITELEEYYLTKCEFEVLKRHGVDIARALVGVPFDVEPVNVIELGAGDGRKTKVLLDVLLRLEVPFEYFAVDISRKAVDFITERMALVFGNRVSVHGVVADNHEGLNFVRRRKPGRKNVVLFLGSSIGNYDMRGAETFLTGIRESLNPGDRLFVGFDLKKDPEIMRRAYSDAKGVTAAFNFNLLTRINHELTADFQPECFYHVANYNVHLGAMESWLLSAKDQDVKPPLQPSPLPPSHHPNFCRLSPSEPLTQPSFSTRFRSPFLESGSSISQRWNPFTRSTPSSIPKPPSDPSHNPLALR